MLNIFDFQFVCDYPLLSIRITGEVMGTRVPLSTVNNCSHYYLSNAIMS